MEIEELQNKMDQNDQAKSIALAKYEKIKGYSSNLFDNEEWREFDAFLLGYNLKEIEDKSVTGAVTDGEFEMRGNRIFVKGTYKSIATIEVQKNHKDITFEPIPDVEAIANGKLFTASKHLLEALQHGLRLANSLPNKESIAVKLFIRAADKAIQKTL
jgi:hypothetical protein